MEPGPGRYSVVHLPRYWYVACLSADLRAKPIARTVLGQPLVLFRDSGGAPSALLDRCPHRNVPLSLGRVRDGCLECRYHGWRFDGDGACRAVPGLADEPDRRARHALPFSAVEQDGLVWVWLEGDPGQHRPPRLPHAGDPAFVTVLKARRVRATLHAALENTLD